MRLLPAGRTAVLVELDDAGQRRRLHRTLSEHPAVGTVDLVPAQTTVLIDVESPDQLPAAVAHVQELIAAGLDCVEQGVREVVEVPVRYDGLDLSDVAELLNMTTDELVRRHSDQQWTVEFAGFMPGFGYMSGADWPYRIPRRDSPRTRIPPGSIALADGFTGVYPQASPGGWQIIGTTDAILWDEKADPPALLLPGAVIRFEVVEIALEPGFRRAVSPWLMDSPASTRKPPRAAGRLLARLTQSCGMRRLTRQLYYSREPSSDSRWWTHDPLRSGDSRAENPH